MSNSFLVRLFKMVVWVARWGMNKARYLTSPKKLCTSIVDIGIDHSRIHWILPGLAWMPLAEIMCPRKIISRAKRFIFLGEQYRWVA